MSSFLKKILKFMVLSSFNWNVCDVEIIYSHILQTSFTISSTVLKEKDMCFERQLRMKREIAFIKMNIIFT